MAVSTGKYLQFITHKRAIFVYGYDPFSLWVTRMLRSRWLDLEEWYLNFHFQKSSTTSFMNWTIAKTLFSLFSFLYKNYEVGMCFCWLWKYFIVIRSRMLLNAVSTRQCCCKLHCCWAYFYWAVLQCVSEIDTSTTFSNVMYFLLGIKHFFVCSFWGSSMRIWFTVRGIPW